LYACFSQNNKILTFALNNGFDPDNTLWGHRPLCVAVDKGNIAMVRSLLEYGAYAEFTSSPYGIAPLSLAVIRDMDDIVRLLLFYNASTSGIPGDSLHPLACATVNNSYKNIQILIQSGADVNT
jgi:ankyrin repeat protein